MIKKKLKKQEIINVKLLRKVILLFTIFVYSLIDLIYQYYLN